MRRGERGRGFEPPAAATPRRVLPPPPAFVLFCAATFFHLVAFGLALAALVAVWPSVILTALSRRCERASEFMSPKTGAVDHGQ